ncbi:7TM diverse intracellular signaling domain-containing protein [Anaerolineales bacterium HSG6]|nr:7TM diverse intracellular signaling domain-containing protein [Anaerolineales bacterium HSG6]
MWYNHSIMRLYLLALLALILTACNTTISPPPPIEEGHVDLSAWNFEKQGLIELNGEWEFYWQQHLKPDSFQANPAPIIDAYVSVPGELHDYELNGESLTGQGYATFRLNLIIEQPNRSYGLKMPDIGTAYQLWINGQPFVGSGVVGIDAESTTPHNLRQTVYFTPEKTNVELIIHQSNFHHRKGGIWHPIQFGLSHDIQRLEQQNIALDLFLFGSLLMMGLYHFGLYALRRKDVYALYFALFCTIVAIRIIVTSENFLATLQPNIPWVLLTKIEYLTFYVGLPIFATFVYHLYPQDYKRPIIQIVQLVGTSFSLIVILTSPNIFTHALLYYQLLTLIASCYLIYGLGLAIAHHREGAWLIAIGQIILFVTVINDILFANAVVHTGSLAPFGLLAFVFMQSLTLSLRQSRAFNKVETLSEKLTELHHELENANISLQEYSHTLEDKVSQRTQDLVQTNQKLQGEILERKNAQRETSVFSQIVRHIGYAIVNKNLIVQTSNPQFNQWVEDQPDTIAGLHVTEAFLELFGFEDELNKLFTAPEKIVALSRIFRSKEDDEQGSFFSINVERLHSSQELLLALISDETAHVHLERHLKQERNDLRLNIIQREQAELALRKAHKTLEKRVDELSTLNLITQTISNMLDLEAALNIVAKNITLIFNARSTGIALFQESQSELTIVAYHAQDEHAPSDIGLKISIEHNQMALHVLQTKQSLNIIQPQTSPLTAGSHDMLRERNTQGLLIIPIINRGELLGTLGVDTDQINHHFADEQILLAETITGQVAGFIANARLFDKIQRTNIRMQSELGLAQKMQYGLLPKPNLTCQDIVLVCHTTPAREVGGDFYNYHVFSENPAKYGVAVGDVSGKGVSAALLMATALAQLDSHLAKNLSPSAMMADLDLAIMPYTKPYRQNCALCYLELVVDRRQKNQPTEPNGRWQDEKDRRKTNNRYPCDYVLKTVNAGGIPPYIKRKNGGVEQSEIGGFALGQGLGAELGYQQQTVVLSRGDLVILTSDGVVEANNNVGLMLGFDRLEQIIQDGPTSDAQAMLSHINQTLFAFTGTAEQHDDMTIVVIEVN